MKRAMGGVQCFASQSPAVLVARALRRSLQLSSSAAAQNSSKRRCEHCTAVAAACKHGGNWV